MNLSSAPSDVGPPPVWVWTGELDAADVEHLTSTWQLLLEDRPPSVVIDLAGVSFLDCAALSVLVRANGVPDTALRLSAVSPVVHRLLQLTGLSACFTVASSWDPAHREDRGRDQGGSKGGGREG